MKTKSLKWMLITIILSTFFAIPNLKGASFSLTSSAKTVKPNATFTISVGGDCIGRVDLKITNGTLSTNSVWVEQSRQSVTVTAGASGTVTITATPLTGFSDSEGNMYSPGSRTITVNIGNNTSSGTNKPAVVDKRSTNNNLKTLTINEGALTPEFNPNTTEYSINLASNITSINISATTEDAKAKITGIGAINLNVGENILTIGVTAENGAVKNYTIKAYVDETPQVILEYKKEKIGIVRNLKGITIPETFTEKTHTIGEYTITIFENEKLTLIYGINEKNEKNFYIFNKNKNEIKNKFIPLNINNRVVNIVDIKSNKENLKSTKITINDQQITCEEFKQNKNYCILNIINNEGKTTEYLYELTESTLQIFPDFLNKNITKDNKTIIYTLSGLLLISIGISSFQFWKSKKGVKHEKKTK